MMWSLLLCTLLPAVGAILWYWGGCGARCHPGLPPLNKAWRRYVWPVIAGLALYLNHFTWLEAGIVAGAMMIVNSLGYGEDKKWWYRIVVALALGLPFMALILWPWPLLTLVVFIPLYILSLRHDWMTWGVVEAAVGATQGAIVLSNILVLFVLRLMFGV